MTKVGRVRKIRVRVGWIRGARGRKGEAEDRERRHI